MTSREIFNPEAERAVLGAILRDSRAIEAAAEILETYDFSKSHQPIYARALELFQTRPGP